MQSGRVIRHIRYDQESYRDAGECVLGIRHRLESGWWLSGIEGPVRGCYIATFGIEEGGLRLLQPA